MDNLGYQQHHHHHRAGKDKMLATTTTTNFFATSGRINSKIVQSAYAQIDLHDGGGLREQQRPLHGGVDSLMAAALQQ